MKKMRLTSLSGFNILLLTALVIFLASIGCIKKGWTDEIADQRTVINNVAISQGDSLPVLLGRDTALTVVYGPETASNKELLWKSSNESIAKVDANGKVTTVGLGSANISVESVDGGQRKAIIRIDVIDKIIYASEINITPLTLTTYPNVKTQLTASLVPENVTFKRLVWSSSNTGVATVDQTGAITGVAAGSATITVQPADGSAARGTIAVEVVTVVPIETIIINTEFPDGMAVDERLVLDYSVSPAGASKQLINWSSNNEAVIKVGAGGILTGVGVGQAVISGKSIDGGNVTFTFTVQVMEGKINDSFTDGVTPRWITPTSGASATVLDNIFWVTMNTGTNRRGDFRRTNTTLNIGKYPILAIKFTRPLPSSGNIFFDTNLGRWKQTTGSGNNQMTILTDKNGEQVFYADFGAFNTFGNTPTAITTTAGFLFSQISIGVADMPTAQSPLSPFPVYWVKTFKSTAELEAYINE